MYFFSFRLAKVQENTIASLRNAASHVSEPLFLQTTLNCCGPKVEK